MVRNLAIVDIAPPTFIFQILKVFIVSFILVYLLHLCATSLIDNIN